MIKAIHFSDFHLGVDTYGALDPDTKLSGRVLDFLDSLDALADYAEDNNADIILFAGDAFHKSSPDPTLFREFGDRIVRMAERCPVVLLVGNHDMPGTLEKASAVDVFATLRVPNVTVGYDYALHSIETKHGILQVATAPYPMRSMFLTPKEKQSDNASTLVKRKLAKLLNKLAQQADPNLPAVLLGHFSVSTAVYGSERLFRLGDEAEVEISDLAHEVWDYVALGHLHLHQDLGASIVYAGSLDRVDFGEEHDKKGFVWLEIGEQTTWEFVEVDARPFVTITVNAVGAKNPTHRIISKIAKKDVKDAIVRIVANVDEHAAVSINRKALTDLLYDSGAFYVHSMNFKEERSVRMPELEGVASMTEMGDMDKLLTYFQLLDMSPDKIESLLSVASDIMEEVNSDQGV